jgi:hypothetical protein
MKKLPTAIVLALSVTGLKAHAATTPICSKASLKGTYSYSVTGTKKHPTLNAIVPYSEMGFEKFDGLGNFTNTYINTLTKIKAVRKGTYNVNQICQGNITFASGMVYKVYVSPSGNNFTYQQQTGMGKGEAISGEQKRVSTSTAPVCSTASLKGTYNFAVRGAVSGTNYIENGFETYDGLGNVTTVLTDSVTKQTGYGKGTYKINADCTGIITYSTGAIFTVYAEPAGARFNFFQSKGLLSYEVFGGHETRVSLAVLKQLTTPPTTTAKTTNATKVKSPSPRLTARDITTTSTTSSDVGMVALPNDVNFLLPATTVDTNPLLQQTGTTTLPNGQIIPNYEPFPGLGPEAQQVFPGIPAISFGEPPSSTW